jgi:uracil-DNA glycosylase family 4
VRSCPGFGPLPADVFLCGEKIGKEEAYRGKPFVGPAGELQSSLLLRHHLTTRGMYLTNLLKSYIGDRPPSDEEISHSTPELIRELKASKPKLVIAAGATAARFFLGSVSLDIVHGMVCEPDSFRTESDDFRIGRHLPKNCLILPIFNPGLGLRDVDARSLISWDYEQVANAVRAIRRGEKLSIRKDPYAGKEIYLDVDGGTLIDLLESADPDEFAVDTEGVLPHPFSAQFTWKAGTGYMIRRESKHFAEALARFQKRVNDGCLAIGHFFLHDMEVLREFGLELRRSKLFDTSYAAYLTRIEAYSDDPKGRRRSKQGLKPLAYRHNGCLMMSHEDLVSDIELELRVKYLEKVASGSWPHPGDIVEQEYDGTWTITNPQPLEKAAARILADYRSGKRNSKGELTDIEDRWNKLRKPLRLPAERELGRLPYGSVEKVYQANPKRATDYGCSDSDNTYRLKKVFVPELESRGLTDLMRRGMEVLPLFEEMQERGMPADVKYFENLADECWDKVIDYSRKISKKYFRGKPFNPKSPKQTQELLKLRKLEGKKRTKGGEISTAVKSIGHHRFKDEAMEWLFDGRESEHVLSSFCRPVLDRVPDDYRERLIWVKGSIQNTRTATRRLAMKEPNLLNIPVRTKLGKRVREGYVTPEGMLFGSWDLSQIEYRILAHFCRDKTLLKLFNTGQDVHRWTASQVFGVPYDQVDKETQRVPAKTTNYLMIYGGTGHGLSDQLRVLGLEGWTVDKCEEFKAEVWRLFPGIPRYFEKVKAETQKSEVSCSWQGMPRYLPGINSRDEKIVDEAVRHAVSQRIQGTAQDMLQNSMIWLKPRIWKMQDKGMEIWWGLQVHDELVFLMEEGIEGKVGKLVVEGLTKHSGIELRVPVEADGHVGKNWGALK